MAHSHCAYCRMRAGEAESEHFIRIRSTAVADIYLHRDQSLAGRLVVASADHAEDIAELPAPAYTAFMETVRQASAAVRAVFPETVKINWMLCGNDERFRHPHLHILPRHPGDPHWPGFVSGFQMPCWPASDARYGRIVAALQAALNEFQSD